MRIYGTENINGDLSDKTDRLCSTNNGIGGIEKVNRDLTDKTDQLVPMTTHGYQYHLTK